MRAALAVSLLAVGVLSCSTAGTRVARAPSLSPTQLSVAEEDPIGPLDRRVQERMHSGEMFGMRRIITQDEHLARFAVESPEDEAVVAQLREDGWKVGIYIASRRVLAPEPERQATPRVVSQSPQKPSSEEFWDISSPINVTARGTEIDLPKPKRLREIAVRALTEADRHDSVTGSIARWRLDARVVRADREKCLGCHSGSVGPALKLGDALGVAIYAFAREEPADAPRPKVPARAAENLVGSRSNSG